MTNHHLTTYTVPIEFCVDPFYKKGDVITIGSADQSIASVAFAYDILFQKGLTLQGGWPWNTAGKIETFLQSYLETQEWLSHQFQQRKIKQTKPIMRLFIARFIDIAFWSHSQPILSLVDISGQLNQLIYVPVNVSERIQFILEQPNHHLSFVQLNELYKELQKKLAVSKLMKK